MPIKFWSLSASTDAGERVLDLDVYGVIAQGFADGTDVANLAQELRANKDADRIRVHINSIGGDMFDGIALRTLLLAHGAPVTSIVEGVAASAASIVAMAGRTVMHTGSMLMVHNPWAATTGDAAAHRRAAETLDKAREELIGIYAAKSGKTRDAIKQLLEAETWMGPDEAKRNGFADEIAPDPISVESRGAVVVVNGITFSRSRLSARLLAVRAIASGINTRRGGDAQAMRPSTWPRHTAEAAAIAAIVKAANARRG